MKELFLFSGLGADQRVFEFLDLSGYKINYIEWITPERNESIEHYARRLVEQIKPTRPVLVGVSFGGVIAQEIGKLIETDQIILISSVKTRSDLPLSNRIMGRLRLHKILPIGLIKKPSPVIHRLFGTSTYAEQELLKAILEDSDERFLRWGIDQMANWKNSTLLKNAVLIHGTDDRILPHRNGDYSIDGGGHFMIVNKAGEISKIIRQLLG